MGIYEKNIKNIVAQSTEDGKEPAHNIICYFCVFCYVNARNIVTFMARLYTGFELLTGFIGLFYIKLVTTLHNPLLPTFPSVHTRLHNRCLIAAASLPTADLPSVSFLELPRASATATPASQ
jgi:hypothetical protein